MGSSNAIRDAQVVCGDAIATACVVNVNVHGECSSDNDDGCSIGDEHCNATHERISFVKEAAAASRGGAILDATGEWWKHDGR